MKLRINMERQPGNIEGWRGGGERFGDRLSDIQVAANTAHEACGADPREGGRLTARRRRCTFGGVNEVAG